MKSKIQTFIEVENFELWIQNTVILAGLIDLKVVYWISLRN
jgi:hypothetical protein